MTKESKESKAKEYRDIVRELQILYDAERYYPHSQELKKIIQETENEFVKKGGDLKAFEK